jgi:hypothetical protein
MQWSCVAVGYGCTLDFDVVSITLHAGIHVLSVCSNRIGMRITFPCCVLVFLEFRLVWNRGAIVSESETAKLLVTLGLDGIIHVHIILAVSTFVLIPS